jgi:hypothetical protein
VLSHAQLHVKHCERSHFSSLKSCEGEIQRTTSAEHAERVLALDGKVASEVGLKLDELAERALLAVSFQYYANVCIRTICALISCPYPRRKQMAYGSKLSHLLWYHKCSRVGTSLLGEDSNEV